MNYLLLGINHRTAPVDIRERLAFPSESIPTALESLRRQGGVNEGMILSTCNRVEVVAHAEDRQAGRHGLQDFLTQFHSVPSALLEPHLYFLEQRDAVKHVFRVASSLDSMVVGEAQILGQIKRAYAQACEAGTVGTFLSALMHRAFYVAKKVRSQTGIASSPVSISYVAVELARKIFGSLQGKSTLILGAGKMSDLAIRSLIQAGVSRVFVSSRNPARAAEVASGFSAQPIPFENVLQTICHCDIVIVSTGASHYVLGIEDAQRIIRERKNRPIFVIDISVPRNVDPRVNEVENVFLYDIDDLKSVADANLRERNKEGVLAEQLVEREVALYMQRLQAARNAPLIVSMREKVTEICRSELSRTLRKIGPLKNEDSAQLEEMVQRIANKICHPLTRQIKQNGKGPSGLDITPLLESKTEDDD